MDNLLPFCYDFGFATELPNADQTAMLHNVFQFRIKKKFRDFLNNNFQDFEKLQGDRFPVGMLAAIRATFEKRHPQMPHFSFSNFSDYDHCHYYNLIIPKPVGNQVERFNDYLSEELLFLSSFFEYLKLNAHAYADTAEAKEELNISFARQNIMATVIPGPRSFGCFEISPSLVNNMNLYMSKNEYEVGEAIKSILNHLEPKHYVADRTEVSLRMDYMQVQVFGERCMMFIDGTNNGMLDGWSITINDADCPVQTIALMAGLGTMFAKSLN